MIEIKCFDSLTYDERMLRTSVFIEEQKFKEEFDEIDNDSLHLVLYTDGKVAACVRFFYDRNTKKYYLGRLCVLKEYRGRHMGEMLVREVEVRVKNLGGTVVALSAQVRASGFYEKLGYKKMGDIYYDEYCEHIHMEKSL